MTMVVTTRGDFFFDRICGSCLFYPMGFLSNLVLHISFSSLLFFSFLLFFVSENILVYQFTQ